MQRVMSARSLGQFTSFVISEVAKEKSNKRDNFFATRRETPVFFGKKLKAEIFFVIGFLREFLVILSRQKELNIV